MVCRLAAGGGGLGTSRPPLKEDSLTPSSPFVFWRPALLGCPFRPQRDPSPPVKFAVDLYGAFPVKRLFLGFAASSLFGAGKAVLRPVACDQVRGARGRGQGTETLA